MSPRSRAALVVPALVAALHALASADAYANELQANGAASGFVIHGPEQTLHDFCSSDAEGRLWLALPGGTRYELITSTADAAIFNPGDGAFHPFQESEVRETLASLRFPIDGLGADVFLLPYPRRNGLESAAGAGLVLLAPGVWPLSPEQQHAELVHELGHVVHRALMPDSNTNAWDAYRAVRGIADPTVYSASAPHANRPHEIFAEDFRALFGDALANYSGTVENATIPPPSQVPGLRRFLLELTGLPNQVALAVQPNPARGTMQFERTGGAAVVLDVFDAQGRGVATLAPSPAGTGVRWSWDGTDRNGSAAAAGVFYARPRDGSRAVIRFTRLR
jgi:hypothetical protein